MPPWVNSIVATALCGTKPEVREASKLLMELGRKEGGRYTGDEMAVGDWASRHDRYANQLHGRLKDGTVAPMSWHCEDASLNWTVIPQVRVEWTAIAERYIDSVVDDRNDHLNWMHEHFADETLVAGSKPELDLGPGQPSGEAYPAPPEPPARHPEPILPY